MPNLQPRPSLRYEVGILPGMPLGAHLKELHQIVEYQLQTAPSLDSMTPEMRELVIITLRMDQLRENPFKDTLRIPRPSDNIFISYLHGMTFFHIVRGLSVHVLGAISKFDNPDGPESSLFREMSITQLSDALLRLGKIREQNTNPEEDGPSMSLHIMLALAERIANSARPDPVTVVEGNHRLLEIQYVVSQKGIVGSSREGDAMSMKVGTILMFYIMTRSQLYGVVTEVDAKFPKGNAGLARASAVSRSRHGNQENMVLNSFRYSRPDLDAAGRVGQGGIAHGLWSMQHLERRRGSGASVETTSWNIVKSGLPLPHWFDVSNGSTTAPSNGTRLNSAIIYKGVLLPQKVNKAGIPQEIADGADFTSIMIADHASQCLSFNKIGQMVLADDAKYSGAGSELVC